MLLSVSLYFVSFSRRSSPTELCARIRDPGEMGKFLELPPSQVSVLIFKASIQIPSDTGWAYEVRSFLYIETLVLNGTYRCLFSCHMAGHEDSRVVICSRRFHIVSTG